ncbi:MAG TPA: 30S ribosomal protein S18 [Nitrospiria bacterium]|nr:30S ribosomal protein S18 [Nitrospiria bacterium]
MEKGKFFVRRKNCRFCSDKIEYVDFKNVMLLRGFLTDRGKIIPRRISGNCASHQRQIAGAIKQARSIALLGFAEEK